VVLDGWMMSWIAMPSTVQSDSCDSTTLERLCSSSWVCDGWMAYVALLYLYCCSSFCCLIAKGKITLTIFPSATVFMLVILFVACVLGPGPVRGDVNAQGACELMLAGLV
jgi:hypothetical protein